MQGYNEAETGFLNTGYDKPENWVWVEEDKQTWHMVAEGQTMSQFYNHWRGKSLTEGGHPYPLPLGGYPFDPRLGSEILVTKAYDTMFHRLLKLRIDDEDSHDGGVVITGQPGVGKSVFLAYTLARLISARQVLTFCDPLKIVLFYDGKVYLRHVRDGLFGLPRHLKKDYWPILAMIDWDHKTEEPPILRDSNIWPIQASSPNPVRWKNWRKQHEASLIGLPLWTMEELVQGFPLQLRHSRLLNELEQFLRPHTTSDDTVKPSDDRVKYLLEGLSDCGIRTSATEELEDYERMDDGTRMLDADEKTKGHDTENDAAYRKRLNRALVLNSTEEFGFAPRDVYRGIFQLPEIRTEHDTAAGDLTYSELKNLVKGFRKEKRLDLHSHRVVAVNPIKSLLRSDVWEVRFKSKKIAREVLRRNIAAEYEELKSMYSLFSNIPEGSSFTGWIFEAIIHRVLSHTREEANITQSIAMAISDSTSDSPTFSASLPDLSLSPQVPMPNDGREVTYVDLNRELSDVTLDPKKYYIPYTANNPLFDSFIISLDGSSAKISILQVTISSSHKGSTRGYVLIRKIMKRVLTLLKEEKADPKAKPTVKVQYLLVSPLAEDKDRIQWTMPPGYSKGLKWYNHQGKAFWMRVPI